MRALAKIAEATRGTRWEGRLYVVGGSVRDEIMGNRPITDFDIVTEESAEELAQFLYEKGISKIEPVLYPRFGTALIRVAGINVELVRARREEYHPESRKPDVEPATLVEDARRRDFTINALMRNLHTQELVDPLGCALEDIRNRILRTPVDPHITFRDDPLRMLRAVRFRWKLNLTPADGLYDAIRSNRERLRIISAERIRDEVTKMLLHPTAPEALADLMDLGLLDQFWPEFRECVDVDQGDYHSHPVWQHLLDVVRAVAERGDLVLTLSALFHDIGKARTRSVEESGRVRFLGHEKVGAQMAAEMLLRLRFSKADAEAVALLVRNHMRLGSMEVFTPAAARRLLRDLGDHVDRLLQLCKADARALRPIPKPIDFDHIEQVLEQVRAETKEPTFRPPLSGDEVMEILRLEPGPEVGRWLQALEEAVLDGEIPAEDKATAREWLLRQARH